MRHRAFAIDPGTTQQSVMRGMRSAGYRPGPFGQREVIVHTVQSMVAPAYLEGRMAAPAFADLPAVA
jgi:hypothetical protein